MIISGSAFLVQWLAPPLSFWRHQSVATYNVHDDDDVVAVADDADAFVGFLMDLMTQAVGHRACILHQDSI